MSARRRRRHDQGGDPAGRTASSTRARPTTSGRSTRATATSCGTTSGRRRAARTSAAAASGCGTTTSTSRRPDNYLVSLDARTGKENWHVRDRRFQGAVLLDDGADRRRQSRASSAPATTSTCPGFLQSFDPETGKLQWKFYTVPMKAGDPGLDTWPSLSAAQHGGGQVWIPGVYDPETNLYIFGTGNPTPGYTGVGRKGDNLFTCSLIAVERRHRQDGVVLPDLAARHARLGFGADADPDRRDDQRHGRASSCRPPRATATSSPSIASPASTSSRRKYGDDDELGEGHSRERSAGSESREGSDDSRVAGLAGRRRRDELAAVGIFAGHRPLLRAGEQRLQHRST